jgi:hypothetical protein
MRPRTDTPHCQMQGTLQVVYSERGMAYDEVNVTLFAEKKTLFTSAWGRAPGQSHPFSFTFPDKCVASNTALPPTWSLIRPVRDVLMMSWPVLRG